MDTGLDENKTELGVLVLSVALKVLADGNGLEGSILTEHQTSCSVCVYLLDEHVKVLGDFWCEACIITLSVKRPSRGI